MKNSCKNKMLIGLCSIILLMVNAMSNAQEEIVVYRDSVDHVEGHKDGVDTEKDMYQNYREQNVVVTNDSTVVALCQAGNKLKWPERSGQDLVAKTSSDHGKIWSKGRVVAEHGEYSVCPTAAVYDAEVNRIVVLYTLHQWPFSEGRKSETAKKRKAEGLPILEQFMVSSDDNGKSWTKPVNITHMMRKPNTVCVFGSGSGIQLKKGNHKGRLIIPGGDFSKGKTVFAYYSDDHGKTWKCGQPVPINAKASMASETKMAELPDGTVILNSRTFITASGERLRTRAFSNDGGVSWSPLENDPALKTVSCNAGLLATKYPKSGKDVLLCSVPIGPKRTNGTIYLSYDSGKTWPVSKTVVPEKYFAYSSLIQLSDGKVGLFYEADHYRSIKLIRFDIDWLVVK